ncbi:MAG: prolipoprotein diacylglyceryl transferase [Pseudomonadota bacterium]
MPFPEFDPVLISIGPLQIRWYALAYIAGILIGWWYLARLLQQPLLWSAKDAASASQQQPISKLQLDDALFYITLGVILGGRLGFVLFYRPELLAAPIGEWPQLFGFLPFPTALAIWEGGMSFHGGFIGVIAATLYFARKEKLDAVAIGDLLACAAPIGLFFGRIANFINGELYGRISSVPWAIKFPHYDASVQQWLYDPRHPSQLYEAALEGALLFVILRILVTQFRLLKYKGAAIGVFLAGYGASRFFVEFFREPDDYPFAGPIGFLTRGMLLSLPMLAIGVWVFIRARNRRNQEG